MLSSTSYKDPFNLVICQGAITEIVSSTPDCQLAFGIPLDINMGMAIYTQGRGWYGPLGKLGSDGKYV